ncbi:MAG: ABC transporter ATP-binding protein [Solirubrobacteraceae bacterium]
MATDWGDDDAPPRLERRLLRRVFGYFLPYRRRGAGALLCILGQSVLALAPALVLKTLIDYLTGPHAAFGRVALIVAAGIGAAIAGGLLGVAESYLTESISQGIVYDLREQTFASLLGQSVGFFTHSRSGDVMSRISNDVSGIEDVIADTVLGLARSGIVAITTLALMLAFDWRLTLVALLLIPVMSLPVRRAGHATYRARKRTQGKLGELTAYLQEVLGISGVLLVKAFVKQRAELARHRGLNEEVRRLEIRAAMVARWFRMIIDVIQASAPALLILAGGYLVVHHDTSIGTVFVFATVLTMRLGQSLNELANTHVNVVGSMALFNRLFQLIDHPAEIAQAPDARALTGAGTGGAIAFEQVTFAYPGAARPALQEISVEIEPGQLVALVGPSGAGKTSLTSLVPRFYDPQRGIVRVDGYDVRELTLDSLGESIGIVFQDTFLFHASIRENLLYARPEASEEEMLAAARNAHLHELISTLPDGYDTLVGERGHRLSGGEKQRVAIARVILKDPRIVILDEATSHLDTLSEQLIQAALGDLFQNRTSLVIAHRLSTVLAADLILVLDQGAIVERGTHRELVDRGELYAALYQRQFRSDPALDPLDRGLAAAR